MNHLIFSKQLFNLSADEQEKKGMEKYGQPLNPLDNYDWLNMCLEEQTDGFKYLAAEKVKRDFIVDKIRKLTDNTEINHWLDILEGRSNES